MTTPYFPGEPHPSAPTFPDGRAPLAAVETASGRTICPDCGDDFKQVGVHWASSTCEYPRLAPPQRELLEGILLAGGGLNRQRPGTNPYLAIYLPTQPFAEWIRNQLGVFATELSESTQEYGAWAGRANEPTDTFTSFKVATRNLPQLDAWTEAWYADGERTVPEIDVTRRTLRALYAYQGRPEYHPLDETYSVTFSFDRTRPTTAQLEDWFGDFELNISEHPEAGLDVNLFDTDAFFRYIGELPVYARADGWPPFDQPSGGDDS